MEVFFNQKRVNIHDYTRKILPCGHILGDLSIWITLLFIYCFIYTSLFHLKFNYIVFFISSANTVRAMVMCFFVSAPCSPGQISESGLVPCIYCPPGYFQPLSGKKVCISNDGSKHIGIQCLSLPCQNGGVCHNVENDYISCDCPPGYLGKLTTV